MVIVETPRLLLREFVPEDVSALAPILSDPQVMAFSTGGPYSEGETRDFVAWCATSYRAHGFGQWAVVDRERGTLIGFCGLSRMDLEGAAEVELGYRLARHAWGQGVASEAAAAVVAEGFRRCGIASAIAIIATNHTASARVAEKVGFRRERDTRFRDWEVSVYRCRSARA